VTQRKSHRTGGVGLAERNTVGKIARLTITNSWFAGLEIALKKRRTILGRNVSCDVCLDDSLVSEEHVCITKTDDGYVVEDLNSRHGLQLNGKEVHQKTLRNGDTIAIGNFELKFTY
jgi:pSer/pThr/pTyr-binding forkhead associated (FHA) protein